MSRPAQFIGTAAITENLLKRKWSATILRHLQTGVTDPAEIFRREPDLSSSAMLERLRTMLRYHLIERLPRAGPSTPVHYRLTLRGEKILKMLNFIEHLDENPIGDNQSIEEYFKISPPVNEVLIPITSIPAALAPNGAIKAATKKASPSSARRSRSPL